MPPWGCFYRTKGAPDPIFTKNEGCLESPCPLHTISLCSMCGRKKSILNAGAVLQFQGRDTTPTLFFFFGCLLLFKARTSMSSVLGLLDPTSPAWGWGHGELWLHLPLRNYLDVTKPSGLCNPCACRCALGSHSDPLAVLGAPSHKRGLHCTWFIRLIWVSAWEQRPKKHLRGWDFTTQLFYSSGRVQPVP